jgi:chaperone modulatory protein CbpM
MKTEELISLQQFCTVHHITDSFVYSLNEFGLVEVITIEERSYLYREQIKDIEKMIRLHFELNINFEGIDTITSLLEKIESMQRELIIAKNRLRLYEEE